MVGNGFWEVGQNFVEAIQPALSRVTQAILRLEIPRTPDDRVGRLYLSESRALLGRPSSGRSLFLAMRFRVEPDLTEIDQWEIQTIAYSYLIFRDDREEIAYHWDHEATAVGAITIPHVHFGKDLAHGGLPPHDRERLGALASAHMPTGLVPITDVLRAAIHDLGVEPIRHQGESVDDARIGAELSFQEAEAAIRASFAWWSQRAPHQEKWRFARPIRESAQ